MTDPTTIRVEKQLRHPPERVFDAFLDPVRAGQWMFRTPHGVLEHVAADPRPGGRFHLFERRGETLACHYGRYVEIERPHRVVFDFWVDDETPTDVTRVTVLFTPTPDGGCRVMLTHDLAAAWAAYADRTSAGWQTILDSLGRMVDEDDGHDR